jgi:hypothetical protein
VVDRRRFTADGEEREVAPEAPAGRPDGPPAPDAPVVPAPPARGEPPPAEVAGASPDQPGETAWPSSSVGFVDLVDLLATQAYAHLTGQGTARGRDLQSARVFIDFLGVLHDKTKGRLSAQEEKLLDDVLYQLRTLSIAPTR